MYRMQSNFVVLATILLIFVSASLIRAQDESIVCPPPGYDSLSSFDIDAFIAAPWYVQMQAPVSYQREDQLFCVTAKYSKLDNGRILVENFARTGGTNGTANFIQLNAIPNEESTSKLTVAPSFLPPFVINFLGPNYFVVAAGPSNPDDEEWTGAYEWAIITGPPPTQETEEGCVGSGVAQEGFWLFTRETVADPELIEEMIAVAESLGRDTSVLKPVDQTDCVYEIPENTCQFEGTRCTQNEDCCSVVCDRRRGFFGRGFGPRRCLERPEG